MSEMLDVKWLFRLARPPRLRLSCNRYLRPCGRGSDTAGM